MIVPNVLTSRRFVVLTGQNPVTDIDLLHRQRQALRQPVNIQPVADRQIVNVLKMPVWNDNHIPKIIRPLVRTDKGADNLIVIDKVALRGVNLRVFDT